MHALEQKSSRAPISQQVMTQQRPKRKAFYLQEDDNLSNKFFNT
jgi:hypothetical protein